MTIYIIRKLLPVILIFLSYQNTIAQGNKIKTDWIFIYYMPYDNNLSEYGVKIVNMIKDSISSNNVVATIQSDFEDSLGMTRYIITKDTILKSFVNSEYSGHTKSYEDYLIWVKEKIEFNKKAVIFLDHGGKLDELCLDEKPKRCFLKVDSLKNVFTTVFNKSKIDLLFLQVCTKGSIEPVYEFKDNAAYTLCSQTELGAPNYYYTRLYSEMSKNAPRSGIDVAKIIAENEAYNMYSSLTLIDNSKLDSFYIMFSEFINLLKPEKEINLLVRPKQIYYDDERYWDLVSFLENIKITQNSDLSIMRNLLLKYIKDNLIVFNKINPVRGKMVGYSGLSIYALLNNKSNRNYNNLAFYRLLSEIPYLNIEH